MAEHSTIEWTDATWNPITGCSVVSPGCTKCYAMKLAGTRLKHHPSRAGLTIDTKAGPVWNGKVRLNEAWLDQPLKWKRPRMIFVCAHGDPFHEDVPDEWIDRVFAVMALSPQHTFQVLTKRADRMRRYMEPFDSRRADALGSLVLSLGYEGALEALNWPLPNVWLGVSVEDQMRADERIPHLLAAPAAIRFLSAEPLLGPLEMWKYLHALCDRCPPWETPCRIGCDRCTRLDWIIAGGESGKGARPMHPDWARSLRDQCAAADVPFFFKQWGSWAPNIGAVDGWAIDDDPEISRFDHREWEDDRWSEVFRPMWCDFQDGNYDEEQTVSLIGKKRAGRLLDGVQHNAMPATLARQLS